MGGQAQIRVGTSGYVYPHWRARFYPEGLPERRWLAFYARTFDTVELNNTFYRLATRKAVEGWAAAVPEGFLFSVKGSRYLTHLKRLKDTSTGVSRFFESLAPLASRVGPVLWQLPPQMAPDPARLRDFLQALPPGFLYVVEPRHSGWYTEEVYRTLEDCGASLCLQDLVPAPEPPFPPPGRVYYRRFHGTSAPYSGRYGREALLAPAEQMARLARAGTPCFAYFNNDALGNAVLDALELRRLLPEQGGEHPAPSGSHPPPGV